MIDNSDPVGGDTAGRAAAEAALVTVVELLPILTDRGLDFSDRQYHLAELQGLAAAVVRATVGSVTRDNTWTERVATAWQRLEQARNVLLSQALEPRYDLDQPPAYQHLAEEYDHLRRVLTGQRRVDLGRSVVS